MKVYRALQAALRRCSMAILVWTASSLVFLAAGTAAGQDFDFPYIQPGAVGEFVTPQLPDGELVGMLFQVDRARLEQTVRTLVAFGTRHTLSSQTDPVRGIGAATDYVNTQMQGFAASSGGRMTVQRQSFVQPPSPQIPIPTVITNVIATIQGSDSPARVYVLTAHLDSRVTDVLNFTDDAPGADSDASGVAVILELARIFATHVPRSTIVLATVAGEEQGLFGSAFMAAQLKASGTDVEGMFSVDRVGSSTAANGVLDRFTIRLFSEGIPTAETASQHAIRTAFGGDDDGVSRQLGRFTISVAENLFTNMRIRHIYRRDRVLRASDQISFLQQGYPAARFAEPHEDFNHENKNVQVVSGVQLGDLPDFLDFDFLARATRVCASVAWSLAQGPGAPKNVFLDTSTLTNDTNLSWDANTESDLAGYEVVWRETSEEDWTRVIRVGNVTSAHLPLLSRDNVFFGVRAVNSTGHHSPVTFTKPH